MKIEKLMDMDPGKLFALINLSFLYDFRLRLGEKCEIKLSPFREENQGNQTNWVLLLYNLRAELSYVTLTMGMFRCARDNLQAELSFFILTIHLCNGLNDKNLVKTRKTCFMSV